MSDLFRGLNLSKGDVMAKGQDAKKSVKTAGKSLKEKRAEKKQKKADKS